MNVLYMPGNTELKITAVATAPVPTKITYLTPSISSRNAPTPSPIPKRKMSGSRIALKVVPRQYRLNSVNSRTQMAGIDCTSNLGIE